MVSNNQVEGVTCFIEHANTKLYLEKSEKKNASNPNCLVSLFARVGQNGLQMIKGLKCLVLMH